MFPLCPSDRLPRSVIRADTTPPFFSRIELIAPRLDLAGSTALEGAAIRSHGSTETNKPHVCNRYAVESTSIRLPNDDLNRRD